MAKLGEYRRVLARAHAIAALAREPEVRAEHLFLAWGDLVCPDPALATRLRALAGTGTERTRRRVPVEAELRDRIEAQLTAPDFGIRALVRDLLDSGDLDRYIRVHDLDPVAARDAVVAHADER